MLTLSAREIGKLIFQASRLCETWQTLETLGFPEYEPDIGKFFLKLQACRETFKKCVIYLMLPRKYSLFIELEYNSVIISPTTALILANIICNPD